MKTTRRGMMVGALAVPTVAGLASWRWRHGEGSVLLHDRTLAAGQRFAEAGRAAGGQVLALEGDSIRLAQQVLRARPALIAGVSRHAEALLVQEAAAEAGYVRVAAIDGRHARCTSTRCRSGWQSLGRMAENAGSAWVEALASYAASAGQGGAPPMPANRRRADPGLVFGWVLARA